MDIHLYENRKKNRIFDKIIGCNKFIKILLILSILFLIFLKEPQILEKIKIIRKKIQEIKHNH